MRNATNASDNTPSQHASTIPAPSSAAVFPRAPETPPHNLPAETSSFIGRDREIAALQQLLSTARLVTLTGPGGSGKTRLALRVATQVIDRFPDGVWWIELAALVDETLVPQAIANAFGLREVPGQPLIETLIAHLRPKELLMVIDDWEHLVTACAYLVEKLLRACPRLKILAASREPLAVAGENLFQVSTLSLPESIEDLPVKLLESESVRLFVERAHSITPLWELTPQNARSVAQLCCRLDGIPLAIELAAARVKVLKVENIAARLDDRFSLLTTGNRTALPRHQTLRATIDWSYDLLPQDASLLFRRLAVFKGGFTLDAAEHVCSVQPLPLPSVLDLLTRLIDRSLVVTDDQHAEERYRMLETIHEYARDKLLESGESEHMHARRLDYFMKLAEQAEPQLTGPAQGEWLKRLKDDHDNLCAALEWSRGEHTDTLLGLRLAGALWRFWYMRGYYSEGSRFLQEAIRRDRSGSAASRAKALNGAGLLAHSLGDYDGAQTFLQESVELFRQVGDARGTAFALTNLGLQFYSQRKFEPATMLLQSSLDLARIAGDKQLVALALNGLGEISRYQGNLERAHELYTESLDLARASGDTQRILEPMFNLGAVAHRQGDQAAARSLLTEGLRISQHAGDMRLLVTNLGGLAGVWGALGDRERAARLFGAADRMRDEIQYQLEGIDRAEYDRDISFVRAAMSSESFETALAQGRVLTLEQAIEYALEPPREPAPPQPISIQPAESFGGLTARERQVAAHIAHGESNREIAEVLVVTERTVESHVTNILNKLGFTTRAQIRKWAQANGLGTRNS